MVLALALPLFVRREWKTCRLNLIAKYVGSKGAVTVRICLFRRRHCTVCWDIKRTPGEFGSMASSMFGTREWDADSLVVCLGNDRGVFRPVAGTISKALIQSVGFGGHEHRPELSLERVELLPKR